MLSVPLVETEHLLCFRLSICHSRVPVHSFLKRNDLNRRRFQSSRFKTRAQLIGDFRNLSQRQSITVYSEQPGEVMIEVDEIETDAGISRACDNHLSAPECERLQRRLKQSATHTVFKTAWTPFPAVSCRTLSRRSSLLVLTTDSVPGIGSEVTSAPITRACFQFAICVAACPTAPAAPIIRMVSPRLI